MNINDENCIKELEACKSKLRKTLLEKESIEERMRVELDEKDDENTQLKNLLSKLKSELRKCKLQKFIIFYLI